jgi:hypothetical protein
VTQLASPFATPAGFGIIGGNLNVGNSGANLLQGASQMVTNPAGALGSIANNYASAYNDALRANQQNYQNILQGYQQVLQQQQASQQPIMQGYQQLQSQVLGDIQGIGASQQQAIADVYAQQQGQASQGLISRGLGNTTVQNAVSRGLTLDQQKANVALSNQLAQLTAGYRSQLGGAALNYQNQANMQNTALASQQLGMMAGLQIPFPSAGAYSALASGAAGLAAAQRYGGGAGLSPARSTGIGGSRGQTPSEMNGGYNLGGSGGAPGGMVMPTTPAGYHMPGSYYTGGAGPQDQAGGRYPLDPSDPYYQTPEGQAEAPWGDPGDEALGVSGGEEDWGGEFE